MKTLITFLAVLLAWPLSSSAQDLNIAALEDGTNIVTVKTGAEYGLMLGAGYARVASVADRPVVLGVDLALQWAEVDIHDFRLSAGALAPLFGGARWKILGAVAASVRGTDNDLGAMTNVGTDVAILAGRYAPRGYLAAELGFDWAIATHIEHGDTYRMHYADARDGWYRTPGGMLRAGLQGGISLGRHDVILRAGRLVDIAGEPATFPFYGTLTFDTRW
jgi:hypothetical protein